MFNHEPLGAFCPFCNLIKGDESEYNTKNDIVYEDDEIIAFISPSQSSLSPGNVLVVPKEHVENIYDINDELLSKVQIVGKKVAFAMKKGYECEGVSFRQHNEPAGYQDVWHYHLHVFPRWTNDELYPNYKNHKFVSKEERWEQAEKLAIHLQK